MNKNEREIRGIIEKLYWFYNADMSDPETSMDYQITLQKLKDLLSIA